MTGGQPSPDRPASSPRRPTPGRPWTSRRPAHPDRRLRADAVRRPVRARRPAPRRPDRPARLRRVTPSTRPCPEATCASRPAPTIPRWRSTPSTTSPGSGRAPSPCAISRLGFGRAASPGRPGRPPATCSDSRTVPTTSMPPTPTPWTLRVGGPVHATGLDAGRHLPGGPTHPRPPRGVGPQHAGRPGAHHRPGQGHRGPARRTQEHDPLDLAALDSFGEPLIPEAPTSGWPPRPPTTAPPSCAAATASWTASTPPPVSSTPVSSSSASRRTRRDQFVPIQPRLATRTP